MGGAIATGMCCCFSCCCQECSQSIKRWLGPERVTKIFYFFLVIIFTIPAMVIFFLLDKWKSYVQFFVDRGWLSCPQSSQSDTLQCVGASAIFRLSLSLLCLFFLMLVFMLFRSRCSMVLNEGLFCFKYMLVVGLFIGFLFIDNQVFVNFSIASQYISIAFMLLQCIIIIDLFYLAGIRLVKSYDDGQSQYACYLVFLTIIAQASAITLNVLGYIFTYDNVTDSMNPWPQACTDILWVNIVTSLILVALPVIQLFHCNPQNSLLTTALVSMYISYLSMIAQFSYDNGNQTCKRMSLGPLIGDVIVSTFFFIVTMYGSIMGGSGQVKVTRDGDVNKAIGVAPKQPKQGQESPYEQNRQQVQQNPGKSEDQINQEKYTQSCDWVKYHFYMCLAAVYIGMLITNWNSASITTGSFEQSGFGFWVRVILSWVTFLLYFWTLIAPRVCPSRDFTVQ